MKNLSPFLFCLLLVSCSHFESTPKEVSFPYAAELLEKVQQGHTREPASLVFKKHVENKSPRRVYFSALYQQYITLKDLLRKKSDIEFCPQFHHDKIKIDSGFVPKMSMFHANELGDKTDYFPEVIFNKEFSLQDYHHTIKEEILALCEDGVSDNFYKYDNLVTHYSGKHSFHKDPKAMASVLKIPVFANFYLVKMLEMPGFESFHSETAFIDQSKTHWFEAYVSEATRMRKSLIKNHMVRR